MSTFPVCCVIIHRRRARTQNAMWSWEEGSSMSSRSFAGRTSLGAASELTSPSALDSVAVSLATDSPSSHDIHLGYKSVWDFEKVKRIGGPEPKTRKWQCGWCGLKLSSWNATKALAHVTKASGNNDVKACTGTIPKETLARFRSFRFVKKASATVKRQREDAMTDVVSENQQSLSVMVQNSQTRTSQSCDGIDMTGGGNGVAASNATKLTAAIAEFVFCKGLPFSVAEGEHFLRIIHLSRLVAPSYRPPTRKSISNELLDYSYENRLEKYVRNLEVDSDLYGLSLFGDGATVHGMPLMNILAAGVGEPSAVLAIVDCTYSFVLASCCFNFLCC